MAKAKDFKFCTLVAPMKFYSLDDKLSLKWPWSSVKFWAQNNISGVTEATVAKFCTHVGRIK